MWNHILRSALNLPGASLLPHLCRYEPLKTPVRKFIFPRFHGGETIEDLKKTVGHPRYNKLRIIADYVREHETRGEEYELRNVEKIVEVIDSVAHPGSKISMVSVKPSSIINPVNLQYPDAKTTETLLSRLVRITERAAATQTKVLIDAEEYMYNGLVYKVSDFLQPMFNTNYGEDCVIYITIQSYFKNSPEILRMHLDRAIRNNYQLGVKIVRGAYMDHERRVGNHLLCDSIEHTHYNYDQMIQIAMEHLPNISLIAATHNRQSIDLITNHMLEHNIYKDDPSITFAQLFGVGDHLTRFLSSSGYNTAKYVPFGPYEDTIPYLFRRMNENEDIIRKI